MTFQLLPSDPVWLVKAAADIGFHETGNNQGIEKFIALAGVGSLGDPWCAIAANAWLRSAGYKGTGSALAKSFSRSADFIKLNQPKRGAIVVFDRGGEQGHVGFWTGADANGRPLVLGGNENDQVMVEPITMKVVGYYWPAGAATQPQPTQPGPIVVDRAHTLIATGSQGDLVVELQHLIGIPEDGDFGPTTRWTVKGYQLEHGLDPDGEVGDDTWGSLLGTTQVPPSQPSGPVPASLSAGAQIYLKLFDKFRSSDILGTFPPPDGTQFGITTGTADQWARFGTACCDAESGFNPRSANTSDPGGSFGIFQYAHNQVPGGDAYDIDASVSAFVTDAELSAHAGSLQRGRLGQRFSTIGRHPERTIAKLGAAAKLAAEAQKVIAVPAPAPAPAPAPQPAPFPAPAPQPAPAPGPAPMPTPAPTPSLPPAADLSGLQAILDNLRALNQQLSQGTAPAPTAPTIPAPPPAPPPAPSSSNTMGMTHIGVIVAAVMALLHAKGTVPLTGADASTPGQIIAGLSVLFAGGGALQTIGPTLSAILRFIGAAFSAGAQK